MEDRFVVRNNSGNILMLPKNRITLTIGGAIDLAQRLNKTVSELSRDAEICLELSHNNLVKVDEFDSSQEAGIDRKLDALMDLIKDGKNQQPQPQPSVPNVSLDAERLEEVIREEIRKIAKSGSQTVNNEMDISKEQEERMREEAIMSLIEKKGKKSNLDGFGSKEKESESDDDFTDLIDF